MRAFVALLRGVKVGGHDKPPMKARGDLGGTMRNLRTCLETPDRTFASKNLSGFGRL